MIKEWFKKSKVGGEHPSEETLLMHVDGELTPKVTAKVRSHLETCWSCRLSLEKIEETISAFVEFRQQIQIPLTQPPPRGWNDFDRKLKLITGPDLAGSWWSRSGQRLGRFFHNFALFSLSTSKGQIAFGTIAMLLVAVLVWQLTIVTPISANELLDKSVNFQRDRISEVAQAVVYQKINVRRNGVSEINWEIWRDTSRSRFRQNVTSGFNAAFDKELLNVLELNGFDPQQPLSSATFSNWRKGLLEKNDSVERMSADNGGNLIVLHTKNPLANAPGQISSATLKLRSEDLHPVGQILEIRSSAGIQTYDFTELNYRVLSLETFATDFFPESPQPQIASVQQPIERKLGETNSNVSATSDRSDKKALVPFAPASADLEIEVFSLLNKAKADLGEQIIVSRDADGRLGVRGIVDTSDRKKEILLALAAVRDNPSVRIEIKSIDEAIAEQKSVPKPPGATETVESQTSTTATDPELLSYFRSEEAARRFGAQMIGHSNRAMGRAYALKRLIDRLSVNELRDLTPNSRSKLLTLVRSHATAFREECEALERELQPVFGAISTGPNGTVDVDNVTALPRAVDALLTTAAANDQVVRSAFTLSSGNTSFTAIKTPQFWQSLKMAEALAAKLQSVK